MIVDSHVHLLPHKVQQDRAPFCHSDVAFGSIYSSEKAKVVSEADIIRYLDDSGIDRAIVFGFPWEEHDLVRRNNDEIWEFHQRFPDRITPFAVLSTRGGAEAQREVERTLEAGFAGIGELAKHLVIGKHLRRVVRCQGKQMPEEDRLGDSLHLHNIAGKNCLYQRIGHVLLPCPFIGCERLRAGIPAIV